MAWRLSAFDRSRSAELAARLCCVLLGLVALWLLVRLVWVLLPSGDVLDTPATPLASDAGGSRALSVSKWHLFGSSTQPPRSAASGAPATTLSMILRGTLAERDPRAGIAVIADEHGIERAWRAGETLAAGVRLAEVHPDHVVLVHDGVEEVLRLPRDTAGIAPATRDTTRVVPGVAAATRAGKSGADTAAGGAAVYTPPEMAHGAAGNWQQTVRELRQQDVDGLADKLQVLPVFENGKLRGVRLAAGADASLISKLGLRPTDVVTAVNGVPLDDLARGQQVVESLRNAAGANVTVLRDGQPVTIHVTLR